MTELEKLREVEKAARRLSYALELFSPVCGTDAYKALVIALAQPEERGEPWAVTCQRCARHFTLSIPSHSCGAPEGREHLPSQPVGWPDPYHPERPMSPPEEKP